MSKGNLIYFFSPKLLHCLLAKEPILQNQLQNVVGALLTFQRAKHPM